MLYYIISVSLAYLRAAFVMIKLISLLCATHLYELIDLFLGIYVRGFGCGGAEG